MFLANHLHFFPTLMQLVKWRETLTTSPPLGLFNPCCITMSTPDKMKVHPENTCSSWFPLVGVWPAVSDGERKTQSHHQHHQLGPLLQTVGLLSPQISPRPWGAGLVFQGLPYQSTADKVV